MSEKKLPIVGGIIKYFRAHIGTLAGLIAICLIIGRGSPNFFTIDNWTNILRQVSINGIIAVGLTLALLIGGNDLSVGSTCAAAGCLVVSLFELNGFSLLHAIIVTCLFGALVGVINGLFVANTTLPCFIITLSTQTIVRGLAYLFTKGYPVTSKNELFNIIGNEGPAFMINGIRLVLPYPVIVMILIFAVFAVILTSTRFGRHIYAIGGNREAALHSGINVKRVQITVFIISSILASISGIILASRMYSGQPTVGIGYEGDAIAASVLGGVSFGGGAGSMGGTLIGTLIIGVINNGMNLLRIDFYYQQIVKGIIILGSVYFDSVKSHIFEFIKKTLSATKNKSNVNN